MASGQMYGVLAIILTVLPSLALATDFMVGDKAGWTTDFNYTAWTADKVFWVGDSLVFNYNNTNHNVFKVNGTAFQNCEVPPPSEGLTTGRDTIPLKTSGKKWYICGKPTHCSERGMKLVINVQEAVGAPTPSPMPSAAPPPSPMPSAAPPPSPMPSAGAPTPSSANGILASGYQAFAAAIALLVIV